MPLPMWNSRIALLTALGVDNFGSGMFLPVALVYVTHVVGLPLATAGTVVALGTVAGLAVPPVAGRLARTGSRRVVVGAELLQALGVLAYLAAFQYAFTVPGVLAPAVVALYSAAVWLPWLLVAASAALAIVALRVIAGHLPAAALRPAPEVPADPDDQETSPGKWDAGRAAGRR